jgi:hypothetical protein
MALVRTDVSEERSAFLRSVRRLLITANVLSSPILVTLMMDAIRSSETSVLTRATRRTSQKTLFLILRFRYYIFLLDMYIKLRST